MEIVEGGERVIERLHEASIDTLFYLLTTRDARHARVELHEFGVTGMFLKPVDADIAGKTLDTASTSVRPHASPRDTPPDSRP